MCIDASSGLWQVIPEVVSLTFMQQSPFNPGRAGYDGQKQWPSFLCVWEKYSGIKIGPISYIW